MAEKLDIGTSTDLATIARKRKLLQALLAATYGEQTPAVVTSGGVSTANWGDALGRMVQAWAAKSQDRELDAQEKALATQFEQGRQADVDKYFDALDGPQGDNSGPLPGNLSLGDKSNRAAIKSLDPELRALGIKNAEEFAKQAAMLRREGIMAGVNAENARTAADEAEGRLRTRPQTHFTNDSFSEWNPETRQLETRPTRQYSGYQQATPNSPPMQTDMLTNKVEAVGTGQLAANPPGKEFNLELQKIDTAALPKNKEAMEKNWTTLSVLGRAETLLNRLPPGTLGNLAGIKIAANQLGSSLGFRINPNITNMEELHSSLGHQMLEKIRALAPVTEEDVAMMQGIIGSEKNTEQALRGILRIAQEATQRDIISKNRFVRDLEGQEGYPSDLTRWKSFYQTPPAQEAPAGGIPIEQIKNKYR